MRLWGGIIRADSSPSFFQLDHVRESQCGDRIYCISGDAVDTVHRMLNGIDRANLSPIAVNSLVRHGQRQQQFSQQPFQQ